MQESDLSSFLEMGMEVKLPAVLSQQFGKDVVMTQVSAGDLIKFWDVDLSAQRELNQVKVRELMDYISNGLAYQDMYMGPLIFSARGQASYDHETQNFILNTNKALFVADGFHRISALTNLEEKLKSEMKVYDQLNDEILMEKSEKDYVRLSKLPIACQIYLDLTIHEEQQLFSDLNQYSTNVSKNILAQYDQRDPVNVLTQYLIENHSLLQKHGIELRLSRLSDRNPNLTSASLIHYCLLTLFFGNHYRATKYKESMQLDEKHYTLAERFFTTVLQVFPKNPSDRSKYICGSSTFMIGLASYVHDQIYRKKRNVDEELERLQGLRFFDWKHDNSVWTTKGLLRNEKTGRIRFHSASTSYRIIRQVIDEFLEGEGARLNGGSTRTSNG